MLRLHVYASTAQNEKDDLENLLTPREPVWRRTCFLLFGLFPRELAIIVAGFCDLLTVDLVLELTILKTNTRCRFLVALARRPEKTSSHFWATVSCDHCEPFASRRIVARALCLFYSYSFALQA